jgi:hypothetical protein
MICRLVLFTCATLAAAATPAFAQHWGHERTPSEGACFYKDADFHGDYFCVAAGNGLTSIPSGLNDQISSIRMYGRTEVLVYRDRNYDGRSSRFTREVRNLKDENWNDSISSLQVRPSTAVSSRDAERVVQRAYQDLLGRNPDTDGMRIYRSHIIDDGWSETKVRDSLRDSPEYREKMTMTYPKAQEVVRQAYLSVLKREPDAGAAGYVDKVLRSHWTQADVERELRKSPEYRKRD